MDPRKRGTLVAVVAWMIGAAALTAQSPAVPLAPSVPPASAALAQAAGQEPGWAATCSSPTRTGALECAMEQSVIRAETRQLVARLTVRVPSETRAPVMMVQLPLGLYLPSGIELQIDQHKPVTLVVQSCDANGCYAGEPVSKELLAQMREGQSLKLAFQNLARTRLDVTFSLAGFARAYASIQ